MKKLIQSIMAIPIAAQIGKAFGRKSLLSTGAELVTTKLVLRSFGAMLALGAFAGGVSWLTGRSRSSASESDENAGSGSEKDQRTKGKSRKTEKGSAV